MRRLLGFLVTATLVLGAFVAIALPGSAVQPPVAFTAQDLPTWQTNGVAWAVAQSDGLVFVGGQFTSVRPPGSAAGQNEVTRSNLVVLDAATGTPTSCAPAFTLAGDPVPSSVRSLAVSADKKTLYVGGYYSRINGAAAQHLAAIDIATCTVINGFKPNPNTIVHTITATATTVYYGGLFTTVAGQTRRFAAAAMAVGTATPGALLPWAPTFDNEVLGLGLSPDGTAMAVGGRFDTSNGVASHAIVVVDTNTGANVHVYDNGFFSPTSVVKYITTDATGFYSASEGTGGGIFDGRVAYDWGTYDQRWRDACLGATQALAVYQGVLYSGSHAHDCSSIGAYADGDRHHLLAEPTSGPPELLGWFPNTNEGIAEQIGPRAMTVATTPSMDYMYTVGEFTKVNGQLQQGITRFGQGPGSAPPSKPTVSVSSVRPSEAQVSWRTSVDNDDIPLTYKVYRDNGTTPIHTVSANSVFWNQPQLSFVDKNLILGSTHSYRVTVTDGDSIVSTPAKSVVITSAASNYAERVDDDGASFLWRYDEPSDTFFSDYTGHGDSATLVGPATYQVAPGAIGNDPSRAIGFGGTSTLYSSSQIPSPSTYSVETWFRTTSTSGGKIIGFGDKQSGDSSNYDKHVYMTNSGQLIFGAWIGSAATVTSPSSYNDGTWHQLVATQGSAGMAMYVDGVRVGKNGTTTNQAYPGYWRVGGDNLNGWPNQPASNSFTGDVDETAVYPTALSSSTVAEHYLLAGGTVAPSGPTDFYGKSVYSDNPTLHWRLGEGSGSTAADASGNGRTGTYGSNVSYGQTGAVAGTSDKAVRFNGNSNGRLSQSSSIQSPTDFSVEAWFKTTSSSGGKIIGFGNNQTGNSSSYGRMIYVRNDGRVVFGVYNGATQVLTTSSTYRDGNYHHVVGTQNAGGVKFYIDGNLVGSSAATETQSFTGYWRIGDTVASWPNAPTSGYLNGTIDEVAVYDTALSQTDVSSHYSAGNTAVADAASPTAPTGVTVGMSGGGAQLGWQPATDNVAVTAYEVHRSSTLGFTPSPSTLVTTTGSTSYTDNAAPAGTVYYRVIAKDAAGNKSDPSLQSSVYIPDTVAPAAPANVTVNTTSTSASVSWDAATDNIGVAQYDVYRASTSGFVPGPSNLVVSTTGTSVVDVPIALGTWYYVVRSRDAAGNASANSTEVSGTVTDTTPPGSPAGVTTAVAGSSVGVSWTAATDDVGQPSYRIYRSTVSGFSPSPSTLVGTSAVPSFLDIGVASGIVYYRVVAVDSAGNTGLASPEVQTVVPPSPTVVALTPTADTYVHQGAPTTNYGASSSLDAAGGSPAATSHLRFAIPAAPAGSSLTGATLRLRTNTDPAAGSAGVQTIRIGSDAWTESTVTWNTRPTVTGAVLGTLPAASVPGTVYTAPLDVAGMQSLVGTQATIAVTNTSDSFWFWSSNYANTTFRPQLTLTFTSPDTSAPLTPNLTATPSGYNVGLAWNAPLDNVGVTGYDVHRSTTAGFVPGPATLVTSVTAPNYSDGPLAPGTYYYRVIARDAAGNVSSPSAAATAVVTDSTAPSVPGDLVAAATATSASLSWTASTDNIGVLDYEVYRSATPGFVPGPSNAVAIVNDTSYEDSPLPFGTYYYRVIAKDAVGNASAASAQASAVVADNSAPSVPAEMAASVNGADVTTSWEPSGDDVAVAGYRVYRSPTSGFVPSPGLLVGSPSDPPFVDVSVAAGTWYYRAVAVDTAGNASGPSAEVSAVVVDVSPPTVPATVVTSVTGASVDVSWTESTDDGAVTGYDVHRSAVSGFTPDGTTLVGTVTNPYYVDAPLGLGTWYYRVVARDAANNVSAASAQVDAVVSDIAPPSAPTGLSATAAGANVTVSWTASTDDGVVAGYDVYRSGTSGFTPDGSTLVGTTIGSDTDLADDNRPTGTWYYVVVAKDSQGNRSAASGEANVAVADLVAPSKPSSLVATPSGSTVAVTWSPSTDDVGVTGYDVYRSSVSGFTPAPSTLVGSSAAASLNETSVPAGTWYYRVIARDSAGNVSAASAQRVVVVAATTTTVVNVAPTADTYANAGAATTNYGSSATLSSRGAIGASTYLRFVLPPAPAGTTLTGASLRIRTTTDSFAGSLEPHTVSLASDAWTEAGVTWNNRPALTGSPIGSIAAPSQNAVYTTSLDPNALLASVGGQVSLAVTNSGTDNLWFWSTNYANVPYRPQLTLTYGPDVAPPSAPTSLSAPVTSGDVHLTWDAANDNVGVAGYDIHRSADSGLTPTAANLIASVSGTSYVDLSVGVGSWHYRVVARDGSGNFGPASSEVTAVVP